MSEGLERLFLTLVIVVLVTMLGWPWIYELWSLITRLPAR